MQTFKITTITYLNRPLSSIERFNQCYKLY